jgi:hypothetical protein
MKRCTRCKTWRRRLSRDGHCFGEAANACKRRASERQPDSDWSKTIEKRRQARHA